MHTLKNKEEQNYQVQGRHLHIHIYLNVCVCLSDVHLWVTLNITQRQTRPNWPQGRSWAGSEERRKAKQREGWNCGMRCWRMEGKWWLTGCWRYCKKRGEWSSCQVIGILVPMYRKKDRKICNNYRGISLFSIPGKLLSLVLLERLETIIDPQLMEAQCDFPKRQGTVDQIWATRQIIERATENQGTVHLGPHKGLWLCGLLSPYHHPEAIPSSSTADRHHQGVYTETWCCVGTAERTWSQTRLCTVSSPIQLLHGQDFKRSHGDE